MKNSSDYDSVQSEIDDMFNQMTFWDRVYLQLVSMQYRSEKPMFKMLFDHKYRPERFEFITTQQKKFRNKTLFRSYVYTNLNEFSLESTEYMKFIKLEKFFQKKDQKEPLDSAKLEQNKVK